jgi:hypothetical protein
MKKLLSIFCAIGFCITAYSDIQWGTLNTISTAGVNASDPQVVLDANANATAIWLENGVVMASTQPAGGTWGTEVAISGSGASSPLLGIDSNGDVVALWLANGIVQSANLPAGGTWSPAANVSSTSGGATTPGLAVDTSGNAIAVWASNNVIESATQTPFGGSWSTTTIISSSSGTSSSPAVAEGGGNFVAVWQTSTSGIDTINSASTTIGGTWSTPLTIISAPTGTNVNFPTVGVDSSGDAAAIWFQYLTSDNANYELYAVASTLPSTASAWVPPTILMTGEPGIVANPANLFSKVVWDTNDNALAVWQTSFDGSTFTIMSSLKPVNGVWSIPIAINSGLYSYNVDVDVSVRSRALALTMFYDGTNIDIQTTTANTGPLFSTPNWGTLTTISVGNNSNPHVSLSSNSNNVNAAAVWLTFDGTNDRVQAVVGSDVLVVPPSNLAVTQGSNDFGIFTEFFNTLTWELSTSPNIVNYLIFRNGQYIAGVSPSATSYVDNNAVQNGSVTYGIEALNNQLSQSAMATVTFP